MPTERLIRLAELLELTAKQWDADLALMGEHIPELDDIAQRQRRITAQIARAAGNIRAGAYDE